MITLIVIVAIIYIAVCFSINKKCKELNKSFNPFEGSYIEFMIFCFGTGLLMGTIINILINYCP